jgi:rhamnulokinase
VEGLRNAGSYEEPVNGVSCTSWGSDYLLFDKDGSLITPAYHPEDPRVSKAMLRAHARVPWETVYAESGFQTESGSTLLQLAAENSKRLKHARHLLPVADGMNFLLSGVPKIERTLASTMQLYNPVTDQWSEELLKAAGLPPGLLPELVPPATVLGPLRPEVAQATGLTEARVVASCSHALPAALLGLPLVKEEPWAYLWPGASTIIGTVLNQPIIHETNREMKFTNQRGYDGTICFYKQTVGLSILDACHHYWEQKDRNLDRDLLGHLAGSSTPFESLIDPTDPRFSEPEDMPLKIQAYCRDSNQEVPRKPGPIYRCVLESLALFYRRLLQELQYLTGTEVTRLYVFNGRNHLLNHFTANAVQLPVVLAPPLAIGIGNVIAQALALGQFASLDEARECMRQSIKVEIINPHATAWDVAYDRFVTLNPTPVAQ